jgi:Ion channel
MPKQPSTFSGVTYKSVGYGDLVLAKPWRLLGPLESLMGILVCGLSMGYFFVVVGYIHQSRQVSATAVSAMERTQL